MLHFNLQHCNCFTVDGPASLFVPSWIDAQGARPHWIGMHTGMFIVFLLFFPLLYLVVQPFF